MLVVIIVTISLKMNHQSCLYLFMSNLSPPSIGLLFGLLGDFLGGTLNIVPPTGFLFFFLWSWLWYWSWFNWSFFNWSFWLFSFAFGGTTRTFFDEFNSMRSSGTVGTFDGDLSFNSLGGRAARTLFFHLTVFVDSGGDALTGTHVNFKVSFSFTQQTIDFNRYSSDKVSRNGTSSNGWSWFSAFFDATIFRSVDEFFWAFFKHDFSGGEAFSVDVSFTLFTSALDAFVFTDRPSITDLSLFVVFISTTQWNTHTATFSGIGNSDMAHWTITAAFGVTNWN
jgi:hypothetical protein